MRLGKLAVVLACGMLLAGGAVAQQPGGFGGGGLSGMLSTNKQLQDELKMEKAQLDKLTAALAKVFADSRDDFAKLRNASADERTAILKKFSDANTKAVETVLKPEQVKRLHQIENQQAGVNMFTKEEVQKDLKLTDDQKDKIDDIVKEWQKELRDLGRGFDPESSNKRQELQKEAMASIRKVLKDDQKTGLKDLTGEPFELRVGGGGAAAAAFAAMGQPGKVLSPGAQDQLKMSAEQKKQLEDLQKEIDDKLAKILKDDQKKQLKDMQQGLGGRGALPGKPPQ
jgi:hypothetical protein